MLTRLQLKNFKGWRDTGPIQLAPLTVFFGKNSSGKSSIEQFLLMLKQTVDSSDRKMVINPGNVNTPVNLGSFEEMIFGRVATNQLEFSFEWELPTPTPLTVKDPRSKFKCSGNRMRFEASVGMIGKKLAVNRFEYQLKNDGDEAMRVRVERSMEEKGDYTLDANPYALIKKKKSGRVGPIGDPIKFYGFPDKIPEYFRNAAFVQDFSLQMELLLRSVSYLGPIRSKGQRLYNWTGGEPESVGYAGENAISAMMAAKERKLRSKKKDRTRPFQEFIAEKLKQLELIDEFEVRQISANRKEYEVMVKTPGSPFWVDLPDVGFGISQVLPVVVQCYYAPIGSILFIEQPELHLHPRAQAHLADLLIDVLTSREVGSDRKIQRNLLDSDETGSDETGRDSKNRRIQLIIETHSEHFLHRLQRRIAEKSAERPITPLHVAAYFAHATGSESTLEPLQIDDFGNIVNWPEDFFGDSTGDLFEMSKAAARRRQQARQTPQ